MNDSVPPHDYAAWIRDYANLVNRALVPVLEDRSDSADEGIGLGSSPPEGGTGVQTDVFGGLEYVVATGEHGQAGDVGEVHVLVADVP